jgi:hypothetical protein
LGWSFNGALDAGSDEVFCFIEAKLKEKFGVHKWEG